MMDTEKTDIREQIIRIILCVLGLFIAGLGVAVTKKGELGVSPISSVANVLSLKFTFLTLGNWLIIWNCMLILGQILILSCCRFLCHFYSDTLRTLVYGFCHLQKWMHTTCVF